MHHGPTKVNFSFQLNLILMLIISVYFDNKFLEIARILTLAQKLSTLSVVS